MISRPTKKVVDVAGSSEFENLPDGRVRLRFPVLELEAVGTDRDDAVRALFQVIQRELRPDDERWRRYQAWVADNIVEVEMTDEEIAEQRAADEQLERCKEVAGTFPALDDESFSSFIESDRSVVVDFWAEWCHPCYMLAPILREVVDALGIEVAKLNVDEHPQIWDGVPARVIPTLAVYSRGERRAVIEGAGAHTVDRLRSELLPYR